MDTRRMPSRQPDSRRGAVVVLVAIASTLIVGFAALTIDVGNMYIVRGELQRSADAAALAAASRLARYSPGLSEAAAIEQARRIIEGNPVQAKRITLDGNSDVEFGRAVLNASETGYLFEPGGEVPTAVRVHVRMTKNSVNGPMRLFFANLLGSGDKDMWARAAAMVVPRDISVVTDLSGSMNDDSELRNHEQTGVNLWNIWICLPIPKGNNGVGNGIDPPPPGLPPLNDGYGTSPGNPGSKGGADPKTESSYYHGPTWGRMAEWGSLLDENYDPTNDPGLEYLPYNQSWSNNQEVKAWFQYVGYSQQEINALVSAQYDDNGCYKYRTAVALGLARWDSGKNGGLWDSLPPGKTKKTRGDGDDKVEQNELAWLVDYPYPNGGSWLEYIDDYMRSSQTFMANTNSDFRCRFGVKTFVNYLLERHPEADAVPDFWDTPEQPLCAVKDAVAYCMQLLAEMETNDQVSFEVYATTAKHVKNLTKAYATVTDALWHMQAGHYDTYTNIGGGIDKAIRELTSSRGRSNAQKVIFLLTDGQPNVTENGRYDENGGQAWALKKAQEAASKGIQIYCVSVGAGANRLLMQQIADIGGGEEFFASGTIDEYSTQLREIFYELGSKRPVRLIE